MTRHERIHAGLGWCQDRGVIRSYYANSHGRGRRWVVEGVGFTERVWTTSEVEAFLLGASEGRTAGLLS